MGNSPPYGSPAFSCRLSSRYLSYHLSADLTSVICARCYPRGSVSEFLRYHQGGVPYIIFIRNDARVHANCKSGRPSVDGAYRD